MPNWCTSTVTVAPADGSTSEAVEVLLAALPELTLARIDPMPEELSSIHVGRRLIDETGYGRWRTVPDPESPSGERRVGIDAAEAEQLRARYGAADWREWSSAHWGTKWDIDPAPWERTGDGAARARLATAWGPPFPAIATLSARHPAVRLVLAYCVEGSEAAGTTTWLAGAVVEESRFAPRDLPDWVPAADEDLDTGQGGDSPTFAAFRAEHGL